MQYSVCIDSVFRMGANSAWGIRDQVRIVKEAGFDYVEFWSWKDKDLDALEEALHDYKVEVSIMCAPFVSLIDRDAFSSEYIKELEATISVAHRFKVKKLIAQTGVGLESVSRADQLQHIVTSLKELIPLLEEQDMTLLLEPLNTRVDHKGYFLESSEEAVMILERVNHPQIKMLFDIYHQQISEGDLIRRITACKEWIGHFHIADNPGRQEPGTGEINYNQVLKSIFEMYRTDEQNRLASAPSVLLGLEFFTPRETKSVLQNFLNQYNTCT